MGSSQEKSRVWMEKLGQEANMTASILRGDCRGAIFAPRVFAVGSSTKPQHKEQAVASSSKEAE